MRANDTAQERRAAHIVLDGVHLLAIETREPVVFPDHHRSAPAPEGGGQRRLAGGDPSADEVQSRSWRCRALHDLLHVPSSEPHLS
jgi:hypothetical protein